MVKRNPKVKEKFLKKKNLKKTPKGKEVDHKVPLADGGPDSLKNMRLIKKSSHKKKTAKENKKRNLKKKG